MKQPLVSLGKLVHLALDFISPSSPCATGVNLFCEAAKRLGVPPPISIQNDFSLVFRTFESDLAEACAPSNCNVG